MHIYSISQAIDRFYPWRIKSLAWRVRIAKTLKYGKLSLYNWSLLMECKLDHENMTWPYASFLGIIWACRVMIGFLEIHTGTSPYIYHLLTIKAIIPVWAGRLFSTQDLLDLHLNKPLSPSSPPKPPASELRYLQNILRGKRRPGLYNMGNIDWVKTYQGSSSLDTDPPQFSLIERVELRRLFSSRNRLQCFLGLIHL